MPPRCTSGLHGRRRHFLPLLCGMACAAAEVAPSAQGRSRCRATRVHVRIDQPCSTARARTLTHTQRKGARCAARTQAHAHPKDARTLPPLSHAHGVRECPRPFVLRDTDGRVGRSHGVLRRRVLPGCSIGASPSAHADEARVHCLVARAVFRVLGLNRTWDRGTPCGERGLVRMSSASCRVARDLGVARCYARRCMVFPLRASCAVPGVVDDFDPMEGSCKIRRFRRGMPHICAGTCAGMCARLRCCGVCASA